MLEGYLQRSEAIKLKKKISVGGGGRGRKMCWKVSCEGAKRQSADKKVRGEGRAEMQRKDICKRAKQPSTEKKIMGGVEKCAGRIFVKKKIVRERSARV